MNERETYNQVKHLYDRARSAAICYKKRYGLYPAKIGIHIARFAAFTERYRYIVFPVLTELPAAFFTSDMPFQLHPNIRMNRVVFEQVYGKDVRWDEVYFPIPGETVLKSTLIPGEVLLSVSNTDEIRL
jgi:hypothetical protein